jgi:hypothetical protein
MKLSEFMLLNEVDKKCAVMNNAVPLAKSTSLDSVIFLFQLGDFYVETYCNIADKTIDEYRILPNTNAIKHYLDAIPIEDLLN